MGSQKAEVRVTSLVLFGPRGMFHTLLWPYTFQELDFGRAVGHAEFSAGR